MAATESTARLEGWFAGRLPDEWFTGPPTVTRIARRSSWWARSPNRTIPTAPTRLPSPRPAGPVIQRFREETREQRMRIADEAEIGTGRKVAWGARCGDEQKTFTALACR